MPPKTKTPKEREEERKRIIEAALALFSSVGYSGLTMRSVAASCGFSATKIYYYFASKEELYFCLMKEGFLLLQERIKDGYCRGDSAEGRLRNVIREMFAFGLENPHYYRIMLTDQVPRRVNYVGTPLEGVAEDATNTGLSFYDFFWKSLREMGALYGCSVRRVECSFVFSLLHGTINLQNNGALLETGVDYQELCRLTEDEIVQWFYDRRQREQP